LSFEARYLTNADVTRVCENYLRDLEALCLRAELRAAADAAHDAEAGPEGGAERMRAAFDAVELLKFRLLAEKE
jgi:hypothetical protein